MFGSNCCLLSCMQVSQDTGKVVWYSLLFKNFPQFVWFSGGSDGKSSVYNVGDVGSIPGSGRFHGGGNGKPLQYSCLENPMDGGAWCKLLSMGSQSRAQLSDFHFHAFPVVMYRCESWTIKKAEY